MEGFGLEECSAPGIAFALLSASPAIAQDGDSVRAQSCSNDTIVVTMQFREQSAQHAPISINAATAETQMALSQTSIADFGAATPDFYLSDASGIQGIAISAFICGIGQDAASLALGSSESTIANMVHTLVRLRISPISAIFVAPAAGDAATPGKREEGKRTISSHRFMHDTPQAPFLLEESYHDGNADWVAGTDFRLPRFHTGTSEVRIPRSDPHRGSELLQASPIWHEVIAAKTQDTSYFSVTSAPEGDSQDSAKAELPPVLDENSFATEEIAKIVQTIDELPPELMLKGDVMSVIGRCAMQALSEAQRVEVVARVRRQQGAPI